MSESTDTTEQLLKQILQQLTAINTLQRFESLGPERICQFLHADRIYRFYLPFANVDLIQKRILATGTFFEMPYLKRVQQMIPPDAVILDAGANIGNHTVFFAGACRAAAVYSFEPLREIFRILEKNISMNGLSQVTPINAALGAEEGFAHLGAYTHTNIGKSSFVTGTREGYPMTTIDALNLDRVDFIKMTLKAGRLGHCKVRVKPWLAASPDSG